MRQSGILAAAALHGLEHNVPRLADDHANARRLAMGLRDLGLSVAEPESNMAFCDPPPQLGLAGFIDAMGSEGVRISQAAGRARMVTHVGVGAPDIDEALAAAERVVARSQ